MYYRPVWAIFVRSSGFVCCGRAGVKPLFSLNADERSRTSRENQQAVDNTELTENQNPVLSTGLDKTLQKDPELNAIITAWPNLPEHIKKTIKTLIAAHITASKD